MPLGADGAALLTSSNIRIQVKGACKIHNGADESIWLEVLQWGRNRADQRRELRR